MFEPSKIKEFSEGFVSKLNYGRLKDNTKIHYCQIHLDISSYSVDLYQKFGIEIPEHIARAVRKRQTEFLAGRLCCKTIFDELGIKGTVISRYPDRQPYWPEGYTGSISHTDSCAIAVITHEGWVGVDVEALDRKALHEARDVVTNSQERTRFLSNCPLEDDNALLLAFSAKESLFKALFPQLNFYFGFENASIDEIDLHQFKIRLNYTLSPSLKKDSVFTGLYSFDDSNNTVTTLIFIGYRNLQQIS